MKRVSLRHALRLLAVLVLLGIGALWAATGAHTGWTLTEITEMHRDEITGIDYPVQRAGFIAGLDLVAMGAGVAGALFGASFLAGRSRRPVAVV